MLQLNKEAKESLRKGVNKVADAVKLSAGAEGKTALIQNSMGIAPHQTKDGVTIADYIYADNNFEELGAQAIKQAANKTVDTEQDGTTTTTILAQSIINQGIDSGVSHIDLRIGMERAFKDVNKELDKRKRIVGDKEAVQIATVSANNDAELGNIVAEVYKRVGLDSTIEVREGMSKETTVNYVEGIKLDRGFILPHFATDFDRGVAELENTLLFIFNGEIKTISDVADQVREAMESRRPLLIICDDVKEEVLASMVKLKRDGSLQLCVTISPEFGEHRKNALEDLSAVTGASVFDPKYPSEIKLGFAKRIITNQLKTVILPDVEESVIDEVVETIKAKLVDADKFQVAKLKSRIANLKSAVAEIVVGGTNDMETKEKKDRVDDAVGALRSAMLGGYVPGGGSALYFIADKLKNPFKDDASKGYEIIREAIKQPYIQILKNANLNSEDFTLTSFGQGVDVKKRKLVNMYSAGIIDSKRVLETALSNAISVSNTIFQTDILILNGL